MSPAKQPIAGFWKEHFASWLPTVVVALIVAAFVVPCVSEKVTRKLALEQRMREEEDKTKVILLGHPTTGREATLSVTNGTDHPIPNVVVIYGSLVLGRPAHFEVRTNGVYDLQSGGFRNFPFSWFAQSNRHMAVFAKVQQKDGRLLTKEAWLLSCTEVSAWSISKDLSNVGRTDADRGDKLTVFQYLTPFGFDYDPSFISITSSDVASPTTINRPAIPWRGGKSREP